LIGPRSEHEPTYRARSPINRVDAISDPLLVFQGRDDPVVSATQTESLVTRLGQLGRTVEVHFYDGEGHGWSRAATVIDELERTEAFLERYVQRRRRE
jgi:dipeptidyl aminopeptidase/acylaminoacyl peptidase